MAEFKDRVMPQPSGQSKVLCPICNRRVKRVGASVIQSSAVLRGGQTLFLRAAVSCCSQLAAAFRFWKSKDARYIAWCLIAPNCQRMPPYTTGVGQERVRSD
jgi:hypothetical protein